jgi:hypothetical protein
MSSSVSRWFGDWRHHVEKPVSAEEVEPAVERGSIPAYAFYFMLTLSALIATFGLLANSAAVIIGIVFAGSVVFFWRYYRRRLRAMLALALTIASLVIVVPPLGIGMDNLLIRNQVYRSLTVESRELLPAEHDFRFTNLSVRIRQGTVFVRGDIVASPGLFTQKLINALREKLSERVTMPVILEFGIIPETILRSTEEANVDG